MADIRMTCDVCARGPNVPENAWCRSCIAQSKSMEAEINFLARRGPKTIPPEVYLAAPFFNPEQLRIVEELEELFMNLGVSVFSPRLANGLVAKGADPVAAFRDNVLAIYRCRWVLAVAVYAGPRLYRLGDISKGLTNAVDDNLQAVNIPDTGTVWETGVAYAWRKPVVGYIPLDRCSEVDVLNIMFTEAWSHYCQGLEELQTFITGNPQRRSWVGGRT